MSRSIVIEISISEDGEAAEHEGYYTIDEAIKRLEELRIYYKGEIFQ